MGAEMKILRWIILAVFIILLTLVLALMLYQGWYNRLQNMPEPTNKNMTFVGNDSAWYQYSKACQSSDGSIIIASSLMKKGRIRDEVSIIKLSPDGNFLWEKKFTFARTTVWDLIPAVFRKNKGHQNLQIAGISQSDNKYYVLLTRRNDRLDEPFVLEISAEGRLLKSTLVKLEIQNGASHKAFLQNGIAWLAFLDYKDKMLNLAKIGLKTPEVKLNAMLFFKQDSLHIKNIIADPKDSTAAIIAYDKQKGCSFYLYNKKFDLKEYFRTASGSEFTVLKYVNNKLLGVIREDSLLEIIDVTVYDKPLIPVQEIIMDKEFRPTALLENDGNFYVCLDTYPKGGKRSGQDIELRKYNSKGEKISTAAIGGKYSESAFGLFAGKDSTLIVIGRSLSGKFRSGIRLFVSKFGM
jgi:hypothetical protein